MSSSEEEIAENYVFLKEMNCDDFCNWLLAETTTNLRTTSTDTIAAIKILRSEYVYGDIAGMLTMKNLIEMLKFSFTTATRLLTTATRLLTVIKAKMNQDGFREYHAFDDKTFLSMIKRKLDAQTLFGESDMILKRILHIDGALLGSELGTSKEAAASLKEIVNAILKKRFSRRHAENDISRIDYIYDVYDVYHGDDHGYHPKKTPKKIQTD